jgi:hypothetical protein
MDALQKECRALYDLAFGEEDISFADALFSYAFPRYLHTEMQDGHVASMLFALPYPIRMPSGELRSARYVYAVATDPRFRGQVLATGLLSRVTADGTPTFLRPMEPSLFSFYGKAGFAPASPVRVLRGAAGERIPFRRLSEAEYLVARRDWLTPPFAEPTPEFLSLGFLDGGAVEVAGRAVAYYEWKDGQLLFKEWLGDVEIAPRVAASLGAGQYELRTPCQRFSHGCEHFVVTANLGSDVVALITMD